MKHLETYVQIIGHQDPKHLVLHIFQNQQKEENYKLGGWMSFIKHEGLEDSKHSLSQPNAL